MDREKSSPLIVETIILFSGVTISILFIPSSIRMTPQNPDAMYLAAVLAVTIMAMSFGMLHRFWLKQLRNQSKTTIADNIVYCEAKNTLIGVVLIWFISFSSYPIFPISMGHPFSSIETWIAVFAIWVLVFDWVLLRIRVVKGWYGYNSMEAMEIVRFVLSHGSDDINGPWGRKVPRSLEREYATSAEKVGLSMVGKACLNHHER